MPALLYDQPCLPYPHHFPLSRGLEPNAPPFPCSPPLIDLSFIPISSPMSNLDGPYSPAGIHYPATPHDSPSDDSPHSKLGSERQPSPCNGSSPFSSNGGSPFSITARNDVAGACRQCSSPMMRHSNPSINIDELPLKQVPPNFWSEGELNDTLKSQAKMAALQNEVGVDSLTALQNFMLLNGYDDQVAHSWLAMDHLGDEFRMYDFKVKKCMRGRSHDWTECPFAHPGEKARRRDPRRVQYCGSPCPDFRKGACKKGDNCEFAHGVFECWLHPARYRTQPCRDGVNCKRRVCFFAHTRDQLRHLPDSNCDFSDESRSTVLSSPSQANTMGKSARAVKSSMHRAMLENLLSLQQQNDTPSWESPQFLSEGADFTGACYRPYYWDASPSSGSLGIKGKCNYDVDDIDYSSPTSTLQHFCSPPFSPLASPCSGSSLEKVQKISSNSMQNAPKTSVEGSSYALSLDSLSTSFQGLQLLQFQQSRVSDHVYSGVQQAEQGRLHDFGKGSLLRAKVFDDVQRENIEQQVPDLDWVSELVK